MTYAAITNDAEKKTQIVSFVEDIKTDDSGLTALAPAKSMFSLPSSKVFAIYPLASHSDKTDLASALDICIVYIDASVEAISGDLATKRWSANASQAIALAQGTAAHSTGQVEYATVTDVEKARKGLLKSREDALAIVDITTSDRDTPNIPLLVLTTLSDDVRNLHVFALPARSRDLTSTTQPGLRHLLSYQLPSTPSSTSATTASPSDTATFSLHASTGKLQMLLGGSLTTFDLSTTLPTTLSALPPRPDPYTSFVRLTPALVLASDSTACAMYDIKYNSLQAQLHLTAGPADLSSGKRKRSEGDSTALEFVAFFSDLGLAVATSGSTLVGLQVDVSAPAYKRSRSGTSLLINSLGKGVEQERNPSLNAEFSLWKDQVDSLLSTGSIDFLERFLVAELESASSKSRKTNNQQYIDASAASANIEQSEDSSNEKAVQLVSQQTSQAWDFENVERLAQRTDRRKALYLLSRMFTWDEDASRERSSLTFVFFSPNIFKWLALTGYMTASTIERALRESEASSPATASTKAFPGDIIRALNELDPEMHIMHEYLSWPIFIDIDQVTLALRSLIKSLDDPHPNLISKLISTGAMDTSSLPSALAASDEQGALDAAEEDLRYAAAQLESGLDVRSTSLRTVFTRLHAFPPTSITSALKSHLTQPHLTFFIQLLRVELADGGWTTRHLDFAIPPRVAELSSSSGDDDSSRPADGSLSIISNLLSRGVDAVGLQGWMIPPSAEKDSVIKTLRAETSAALEGAHEASELSVFLSDFERYARNLAASQKEHRKVSRQAARKVDVVRKPGFEERREEVVDSVLPVGMKVQKTERMIARSGGREQTKSKALLGKERSMRVAKYSLDRIRV